MIISRVWGLVDKSTFKCKPIRDFVLRYMGDGTGWLDPFAGESSWAEERNDLNPERPAQYHLDAVDFLKLFATQTIRGVIFDPPYSLHEVSRHYKDFGIEHWTKQDPTGGFFHVRDEIARILKPGGIALSFGWSSGGMGKVRGFEQVEILLVNHGGARYDTICVAERKLEGTSDNSGLQTPRGPTTEADISVDAASEDAADADRGCPCIQ